MTPPNVVLCLCDQLRAHAVGCYGDLAAQTPHIDRLAAGGVRFDLAMTNNPVCTPARSSLLSGQYGRTCTGELGNVADDPPCPRRRRLPAPTLAERFREAGYQTAVIGKWHLDPAPRTLGFEHAVCPLTIHRYRQQTYIEDDRPWFTVGPFAPDYEAGRVRDYLAARGQQPFFLFYNISLPHMPIGAAEMPEAFAGRFDPESIPLRPNVFGEDGMAHNETWFKVYTIWDYFWRQWGPCWNAAPECGYPGRTGEQPGDALPPGFDLRHLTALYYGAVSWTDALVGQLMAALADNGLEENTLVVFLSDHGDNLGSHHLFNKDCLYEESIRIPLVWHWPRGLIPRVNTKQVAQMVDVAPTLLDLCGLAPVPEMQGRSLAPLVKGGAETLGLNCAFIETDPSQLGCPYIGVRTPRHLFAMPLDAERHPVEGAADWLFDLEADPFELRNLAETAEGIAEAAGLRAQLERWNRRTPWLKVGR
ncbi:MAG: Choline-sulfatase [Lentisphaerae bacterium ADurb.BinA184]|nr:MAG: Choline-sulfatase [Lentisphaerae bacterium ADurb.BinA184]